MTDQSSIISLRRKLEKEAWEIKSLGEIATEIISGKGIEGSQLGTGDYPAIRNRNIGGKLKQRFEKCIVFVNKDLIKDPIFCECGDVLITTRNSIRENIGRATVYLGNDRPIVGNNIFIIKHNQNGRFLSYILGSRYVRNQLEKEARMGTVAQIHKYCLTHIKIPLPPRHIQDQIADYLDKWTNLESQLEQELEQELEQRKKQYEYYKESLLNSGMNKWEICSLDKIAVEIISGNEVVKAQLGSGNYPAIRYAEIFKKQLFIEECASHINHEIIKSPRYCQYGDLLISGVSENSQDAGKAIVYLGKETPIIGQAVHAIKHKEDPKFLSYILSSKFVRDQFKSKTYGVTIIHITKSCFKHIKIPLPSLEEQAQIVELLDKFHTITESFKDGLPSLIEKHRKQYTYYKEQILNPEISL